MSLSAHTGFNSVLITCVLRMVYSFNPKEPKTGKPSVLMFWLSTKHFSSALLLARDPLVHGRIGSCSHLCLPSDLSTAGPEELWAFQYCQKLV